MKKSNTTAILALGISIVLFVAGQFLFVKIFQFFEPRIEGILFQITERPATIRTSLLFSLFLFLIPVVVILTWSLGHISSVRKRIVSVLLILACIVIGIFVRHRFVKIYFTTVVKPALPTMGKANVVYPIDPVYFVYYMITGLVLGSIIAFVLFKRTITR